MKTIKIPLYGEKLIVVRTQAEFNTAYSKLLAHAGDECCEESVTLSAGGMTTQAVVDNELFIISGMFVHDGGMRCHEATHCAQAVAEAVRMNPIRETEAFAYLTQWFYEVLSA